MKMKNLSREEEERKWGTPPVPANPAQPKARERVEPREQSRGRDASAGSKGSEDKEEEEVRQRRVNGGCDDKVKELSESEDEDDEGNGEKRRREKFRSERKMEVKRVPAVERLGAKRDASPPRGKRLKKWAEQSENGWFMSSSSGGSGRADADEESVELLQDYDDGDPRISTVTEHPPPVRHVLGDPAEEEEKGPVMNYPTMEELDEGYILDHMQNGNVCGGTTNMGHYKFIEKITHNYKFDHTPAGQDEIFHFKRTIRNFIETVKTSISKDVTSYTIIAVFMSKTTRYYHTLKEMIKIENYYTSFRHFINDFIKRQWPNVRQHALMLARVHKQKPGQSIESYYESHVDVHEETGRPIDDSSEAFIDGIYNHTLRRYVRMHDYGDDRTLSAIRSFASKTSQNLRMEGERSVTQPTTTTKYRGTPNFRRGSFRGTGTISAFNRTTGAVRGRGAGRSQGRGAAAAGGFTRRGTSVPFRGRAMSRGAATRGRASTTGTRGAATRGRNVSSFSQNNTQAEAAKAANTYGLRGCYACGAMGHTFEPHFRSCVNFCPYCKKTFNRNESRHFSSLCRKMPKDKAERVKLLKEAFSKK